MAQIVPQFVEIAVPVASVIVAVGTANAVFRTVVFTTLKHFGAYDPRWDKKWPRLPWRWFWLRGWIPFQEWKEENFGSGTPSAGLAGAVTQLALTYEPGQSLIGHTRLPGGFQHYSLVGEPSERHKVYVASARSGKSLQLQTEMALMPDDARALVIDPKGHHTQQILFSLEERGHELIVLDPLGLTGRPTHRINLHEQIRLFNAHTGKDRTTMCCDRIASLYFPHNPQAKNPFFDDTGREGWARISRFAMHKNPNSTELDVRRLVTRGYFEQAPDDPEIAFGMLWEDMLECEVDDGYCAKFAADIISMDARTRASVLSTIRSKTAFLDHQQVKDVSCGNDVNLCDLKNPDSNLIISIPVHVGDMKTTLRPWVGAITSLSLAFMEWIDSDLKTKTRFYIEEAQAIGETALPGLGDKAALMAGMGLSLNVVVQDFPGFQKGFPNDWKSILGNAQHVIFMACNDPETIKYIVENALGDRTVKRKKWRIPFLWTVGRYTKPVMTADQVRRYLKTPQKRKSLLTGKTKPPKAGSAIVMRNGKRSMFVKIAESYKVLPVWMNRPSKDHGETPARAWFRSVYESSTRPRANPLPPSNQLTQSDLGKLESFGRRPVEQRN